MEQPAPIPAPPQTTSFAGLLASLTSAAGAKDRDPDWPGAELGDDVVTLSYENALRTHARYKSPSLPDMPLAAGRSENKNMGEDIPAGVHENSGGGIDTAEQPPADADLRSASVTVRLTASECARLRQRAAEAGLTLSAYLRSCTFEVESLRAQVKETLAALKSASGAENPASPARRSWNGWIADLVRRHPRSSAA